MKTSRSITGISIGMFRVTSGVNSSLHQSFSFYVGSEPGYCRLSSHACMNVPTIVSVLFPPYVHTYKSPMPAVQELRHINQTTSIYHGGVYIFCEHHQRCNAMRPDVFAIGTHCYLCSIWFKALREDKWMPETFWGLIHPFDRSERIDPLELLWQSTYIIHPLSIFVKVQTNIVYCRPVTYNSSRTTALPNNKNNTKKLS